MNELDWNLARAFLATAQTGSLSAAARRLGLTQPTLSRQVAALETALGVCLFERVGKKLALTDTGGELLAHVRNMGEAANDLILTAEGRSEAIEGRVTISASDAFSAYLLPEIVARVREQAPGITLSIECSNDISDLRRREADIAIRHVRPEQPDLVGTLVRETAAHLYAADSWVVRHGMPETPADIPSESVLGYGHGDQFTDYINERGFDMNRDDFRLLSDNWVVIWEMVKRGLGVAITSSDIAERTPDVVRLLPDIVFAHIPLWLVTHRELKTSRRIRVVFDLLADELKNLGAQPRHLTQRFQSLK